MSRHLFILNEAPYGSERAYNALRLAGSLAHHAPEEVRVFLMGDASICAKKGQQVPDGYYNVQRMLKDVTGHGADIGVCGTCMDARGILNGELTEGTHRGTMAELANWTEWADKVLVF